MAPDEIPTFIVLDTNVYLHCTSFHEVDWPRITGRSAVTIVLPVQVFREIDRQKTENRSAKVRHRATDISARLGRLLMAVAPGEPAPVRERVQLVFYHKLPADSLYSDHNLDPNLADDRILAAALQFREGADSSDLIFLSRDHSASLNAHAIGLHAMRTPPELELADEPDPNEVKLRDLNRELRLLRDRIPILEVAFPDGHNYLDCEVPRFPPLTDAKIEERLDEAAAGFPTLAALRAMAGVAADFWTRDDTSDYVRNRQMYLENLRNYVPVERKWAEHEARSVRLPLRLRNQGTAPATDITLSLRAPVGVLAAVDYYLPTPPTPPREPPLPQHGGTLTRLNLWGGPVRSRLEPESYAFGPSQCEADEAPAFGFRAVATRWMAPEMATLPDGRTEVEYQWRRLQQSDSANIVDFVCVFESFDAVQPFEMEYEIRADELPRPRAGVLRVVARLVSPVPSPSTPDVEELIARVQRASPSGPDPSGN